MGNDVPVTPAPRAEIAGFMPRHTTELNELIAAARTRLAALQATVTSAKAKVDLLHARLFKALRPLYEKRDQARLTVASQRLILDAILHKANEAVPDIAVGYERAKEQSRKSYEETAAALSHKHDLTVDEEAEIHNLWKRLVKLYHPDRFANDPEKQETYTKLASAINHAKDTGDLAILREIAEDPIAFIHRQGWASLDFTDSLNVVQLEKLLVALLAEIEKTTAALQRLRESTDYELCQSVGADETVLVQMIAKQRRFLDSEIAEIEKEAFRLAEKLKNLGHGSP